MIRAALAIVLLCPGCAPSMLAPDRVGVGTTFDADTGDLKTYQFNLYWNLRASTR